MRISESHNIVQLATAVAVASSALLGGVLWSGLNGLSNRGASQRRTRPIKPGLNMPTDVAMRQSPDFRLVPLLPEVLDRLHIREQIMDSFNQQYIFLRDEWRG